MTLPTGLPLHPDTLFLIFAGPVIGSFLGVVLTRLPAGISITRGRSRCDRCGAALKPWDLVPIISWLLLRGRCRYCKSTINSDLVRMELLALAVPLWAATAVPQGKILWISCALGWGLLILAFIDARHFRLPDALTLPLAVAGLCATALVAPGHLPDHVIGGAVGYAFFWSIRWFYRRLRGMEGLGGGDVKLFAAAGFWLGWMALPAILLIATITTLGFYRVAARDKVGTGKKLPFGIGLCCGTWLVWLYGTVMVVPVNLMDW